jgi:release factor glutamine methyltransferase
MSQANAWTVGRLLTWTTDYLKQQGATSPRLDAEVLLASARGCERIQLYTSFDEEPDEDVRAVFRDHVRRRAAGEPVAYLVGHREFFSLDFHVTRDVLIPRPETEHLVVELLDLVKALPVTDMPVRVADVGTGCGAIAISVAKHASGCHVTAVDVSAEAIGVARGNADSLGVADQLEFATGDLLSCLPADRMFDIVASNPPYVSRPEWQQLPREVRDFEPSLALVGGDCGTEIIARLVPQAAEQLRDGGWLLMEIGPTVEQATHRLLAEDGHFDTAETVKDLAGLPRVIRAQRRAR